MSYLLDRIAGTDLTAREHACILLKVPQSGDPELDPLIRASLRAGIAAKFVAAVVVGNDAHETTMGFGCAIDAIRLADALLFALEAPGGAG